MKINELTGIKNYPKANFIHSLENFLIFRGFIKIGSGFNSVAFLGKTSVLKIFQQDKSYENYITLLKLTPNEYKVYTPKITAVRNYPPNPEIKFIKIEKLEKFKSNISNSKTFKEIFKLYNIPNKKYKTLNALKNDIKNDEHYNLNDIKFLKQFPIEFINFVIWLYYNKNDKNYWDLHNNNIMLRGNTPVVIDPYS
jgi:hypothetical protein